jgi:hypothetical protein
VADGLVRYLHLQNVDPAHDNLVHDNLVHDNLVHDNLVHDNLVHDNLVEDLAAEKSAFRRTTRHPGGDCLFVLVGCSGVPWSVVGYPGVVLGPDRRGRP